MYGGCFLCPLYPLLLLDIICKVSNGKTLSGEMFCFLKKRSLIIIFFLRAADWPTTNFLGMYCYFPVIRLVNFV